MYLLALREGPDCPAYLWLVVVPPPLATLPAGLGRHGVNSMDLDADTSSSAARKEEQVGPEAVSEEAGVEAKWGASWFEQVGG